MDKETIIKGCENWVSNHKDEDLLLTYSSLVVLLDVLKKQGPVCVKESELNKCVCGNIVNRYYHPEFCGYCGKKLMWY